MGRARTEGFEAYAEVEPLDWLLLHTNYTYTDSEDETNGGDLVRIPRHRWTGGVTVTPHPKLSLFAQVYVVSRQFDPSAGPGGTGGSHNPRPLPRRRRRHADPCSSARDGWSGWS